MPTQGESKPDSGALQAADQVAGGKLHELSATGGLLALAKPLNKGEFVETHDLLKALQDKIGKHPEIGQAIHKLETALAILEVQTGGML